MKRDISDVNIDSSVSIKPNGRDEVVTMGFFIDFMTEFKRDLFEMLDIRFNAIEGRLDNLEHRVSLLEKGVEELRYQLEDTNTVLKESMGQNSIDHVKFDRRIKLLEKAT